MIHHFSFTLSLGTLLQLEYNQLRYNRMILGWMLGCVLGFTLGCSTPSPGSDPQVQNSSINLKPLNSDEWTHLITWLDERVNLMIQHKANCNDLAGALVQHYVKSKAQVQQWKKQDLDQRVILYLSSHPEKEQKLKLLLQKGSVVYSFCAFFSSFRDQLQSGVQIGF